MTAKPHHDLATISAQWHDAKRTERQSAANMYAAIVAAVDSGMSESEAARIAGVDRMTVRRALGKGR